MPCMKMVKEHGGHSIAVYDNEDKQKTACQLVKEGRVNSVSYTHLVFKLLIAESIAAASPAL